jgi:hypothetical protein
MAINLMVRPVLRQGDVLFIDASDAAAAPSPAALVGADEAARSLEEEAAQLKAELRATVGRADTQARETQGLE